MEGDRKRSGPSVSGSRKAEEASSSSLRGRMSREGRGKGDRARIIRLDISGIFTKGTRRNACSIS